MITTLNMGGGKDGGMPDGDGEGKMATVIRGERTGEIVRIIEDESGQITAVWIDKKGTCHRFSAPSTTFEIIRTKKKPKNNG